MMAVIVDGGGCNLGSMCYALERIGVRPRVSRDANVIRKASHVILPGVGSAPSAMQRLRDAGLDRVLCALQQPLLGVCLGMQLLFAHSEEGNTGCLGLLPGKVHRMQARADVRVPHIGWNELQIDREDELLEGMSITAPYAYFVHSYAAPLDGSTLARCEHGEPFAAIIRHKNICGMQFHPERSGELGAQLLANFLRL